MCKKSWKTLLRFVLCVGGWEAWSWVLAPSVALGQTGQHPHTWADTGTQWALHKHQVLPSARVNRLERNLLSYITRELIAFLKKCSTPSVAEGAMFCVSWDAGCPTRQVKAAAPVAPRAALCAPKHNPAGCCEGLPSSSSSAACLQLGWPQCLKCYVLCAHVQCTSANNPGHTGALSHFTKQPHGKNCFQTYKYAP